MPMFLRLKVMLVSYSRKRMPCSPASCCPSERRSPARPVAGARTPRVTDVTTARGDPGSLPVRSRWWIQFARSGAPGGRAVAREAPERRLMTDVTTAAWRAPAPDYHPSWLTSASQGNTPRACAMSSIRRQKSTRATEVRRRQVAPVAASRAEQVEPGTRSSSMLSAVRRRRLRMEGRRRQLCKHGYRPHRAGRLHGHRSLRRSHPAHVGEVRYVPDEPDSV